MQEATHALWMISWQALVFALLVFALTRLAVRAPSAWKHTLWVLVLVKFVVPPFVYVPPQLVALGHEPRLSSVPVSRVSPATARAIPNAIPSVTVGRRTEMLPSAESAPVKLPDGTSLLTEAWMLGVLFMSARLIRRHKRVATIMRASVPADDEARQLLAECASRLRSRRIPSLQISEAAHTPMLVGLLKPAVILPSTVTTDCSRSDLSSILMHELAHMRRQDMLVLWLEQAVQVLFYFHPVVWFAECELRRERELACDDLVLSTPGVDSREYAAGYISALRLAKGASRTPTLAMAEPFEMEKRRLETILNHRSSRLSGRTVVCMVIVLSIGVPTIAGIRDVKPPTRQHPRKGEVGVGSRPAASSIDWESAGGPAPVYVPREGNIRDPDSRDQLLADAAFDEARLDRMLRQIRHESLPGDLEHEVWSLAESISGSDPRRAIALLKGGLRIFPRNTMLLGLLCETYGRAQDSHGSMATALEAIRILKSNRMVISSITMYLLEPGISPQIPESLRMLSHHRDAMAPRDYMEIAKQWEALGQAREALRWINDGIERTNKARWPSARWQQGQGQETFQVQAESEFARPETYEIRLRCLSKMRDQDGVNAVLRDARKYYPNYPFVENVPEIADLAR